MTPEAMEDVKRRAKVCDIAAVEADMYLVAQAVRSQTGHSLSFRASCLWFLVTQPMAYRFEAALALLGARLEAWCATRGSRK